MLGNIANKIQQYFSDNIVVGRFIEKLSDELPETVVFGGMIRDFSLNSSQLFKSDIDLVTMADNDSIYSVISSYNPVVNKFDGFRFAMNGQMFDIWSFKDTWAIREGFVQQNSMNDLCGTTFFNLDAAYLPLKDTEIVCSTNFITGVKNRVLDINLHESLVPKKMVAKAIYLSINNQLSISPRLQAFIIEHADDSIWNQYKFFLGAMENHHKFHEGLNFNIRQT